jgi:environmental stress-induced protein Ves
VLDISTALVKFQAQPIAVWRGGTTRAIYAQPPDKLAELATAHVWVGTATIERDGPYSVFANRTRVHLPIRGSGLQLHFQQPQETVKLSAFEQVVFAGDRPLDVMLVDGPVEAFNLIFHPAVQASLHVLHLTAGDGAVTLPPLAAPIEQMFQSVQVIYAVNGECKIKCTDGQEVLLQAGDALVRQRGNEISVGCIAWDADVVVATLGYARR